MRFLLINLISFLSLNVSSQKYDTIYFDKNWQITEYPKCDYYRTAEVDTLAKKRVLKIKDFYKNGRVSLIGTMKLDEYFYEHQKDYYCMYCEYGSITQFGENGDTIIYSEYKTFDQSTFSESLCPDSLKDQLIFNKHYFKNGRLSRKGFVDREGKKHGNHFYYNKKGKLTLICHFNFDNKDRSELYYKNGNIRSILRFKNDQLDGICENYTRQGKLLNWDVFKEGKLNGTCILLNSIDYKTILRSTEYELGVKHGEEKIYDNTGKVKIIRTFENGKLIKRERK